MSDWKLLFCFAVFPLCWYLTGCSCFVLQYLPYVDTSLDDLVLFCNIYPMLIPHWMLSFCFAIFALCWYLIGCSCWPIWPGSVYHTLCALHSRSAWFICCGQNMHICNCNCNWRQGQQKWGWWQSAMWYAGTHCTNVFYILIQIWCKFHCALIQILI